MTKSPSADAWKVDDDSSELEAMSSSDLKYIREQEAKNGAGSEQTDEMRLAEALVAATKNQEEDISKSSKALTPVSSPSSSEDSFALSAGNDAFDIGLLIAAPIIIGTLGLFFIFPLIKDQLAANLPMPPTS